MLVLMFSFYKISGGHGMVLHLVIDENFDLKNIV